MRSVLIITLILAGIASARAAAYEEVRNLELAGDGIRELDIDAGAGSMKVRGISGSDAIRVTARIQVDEDNPERAREIIAKSATLVLDRDGDEARLQSNFKHTFFGGAAGSIALDIEVPVGLAVDIDDSSGSIVVEDTGADVKIEDSSGSIKVSGVASIDIEDSSGSIQVSNASGDVDIDDGSGSIAVSAVGGSVTIDDGSGSIHISDVDADVVIDEDGSGSVEIDDVRGTVTRRD